MQVRILVIIGILVFSLGMGSGLSFAAEHGGTTATQEHGGAAATQEHGGTAATQEHGGATTTSAPAEVTPPALKPITITFSGELKAVDSAGGSMTVEDRYGVKKDLSIPATVQVTQGGQAGSLSTLSVGQSLTVEYTYDVATGHRTAQSILVES